MHLRSDNICSENIGSRSCYKIYPVLYGVVISIYCICTIIIEFACPRDSKVIRPNIFHLTSPIGVATGIRHTLTFSLVTLKSSSSLAIFLIAVKLMRDTIRFYLNRQFRHFNIINCYCGVFSVAAGFHIGTCHIFTMGGGATIPMAENVTFSISFSNVMAASFSVSSGVSLQMM